MKSRGARFRNAAWKVAMKSDFKQPMGAVLVKGGSIISSGWNKNRYCGYASRFRNIKEGTFHAEVSAIYGLPKERTKGADLYVVRARKDGTHGASKPCPMCEQILREAGISRVYYTCELGERQVMRINQ